jgi:hypothetical protein
MNLKSLGIALALTLCAPVASTTLAEGTALASSGADLHIHNKTGESVELWIFEDDKVHTSRAGGVHAGDLADGETGTAHVKACHFSVVLFHGKDAYHAEFHDCAITDITITAGNH